MYASVCVCVCVCVCVSPNYKQSKSPSKHKMIESENLEPKKTVILSCLPALPVQMAEPLECLTSRTRGRKLLVHVCQEYHRTDFNCVIFNEIRFRQVRPKCESNNCEGQPHTALQYTHTFMFANLFLVIIGKSRNLQ